jgi:hypothetical protein
MDWTCELNESSEKAMGSVVGIHIFGEAEFSSAGWWHEALPAVSVQASLAEQNTARFEFISYEAET